MITLYFNDTSLDVHESEESYRYRSIMGEHNLTLKFSLPEYIEFPIGTWCEYMAVKYTLEVPANFKKHGNRNFEYTLLMQSVQVQLGRYKLRNTVDKRLKFSMCATPKEFLQTIVDNLNQRDSGWSVGDCIVSTEKTIPFDHSYIDAALQSVADTFNTEWEIVGKVIHLRKVEYFKDDPLPLSYGKGNGFVPGLGRSTESESRPIEIMFAQGGSKNIDRSKYGAPELLLPKSQTLEYEGRTYISDAEGYSIQRKDKPLKYKTEDSLDCSEIYPSRVGTVSKVEVIDEANNFYDVIDDSIPENLDYNDYLIEGENMTIIFQSGMLAGNDKAFELKYKHAERRFEIVPQEIDGQTMPGGVYVPRVGDTYAIFGCMLPDAYVCDNASQTGASWDMFRETAKALYEKEDVKFTFTGELQGMWAKRNWLKVGGKLVVGGYVLFSDNQFAPDGIPIRITGIKDYPTSPYSPTIELSNDVQGKSLSSTIDEIQNGNVIVEDNDKEIIRFTKRRFRDAVETMKMLEDALLENFTSSITPITVQTMAMLVGDESLQFRFVDSSLRPIQYHITYNQETKQLIAPATILQHMTLGIDTITSDRSKTEYKHWNIKGYTSPVLDQLSQQYYFYAKVPTGTGEGEFVLSPTAIGMDDVSGFYHLLVGILNSEYEGERSFVTLYGFTEVLPGRITTDKIVSPDGKTYFDVSNGEIGGNIKIKAGSSGLHNFDEWEVLNTQISAIEKSVEAIDGSVDNLGDYIDGAFADGLISEAEAKAIEKYINTVNNTKAAVEATYNKLYSNSYLTGTSKTNLLNAKVTLFGAIENLISAINTAIADGKTTTSEKSNVDSKFSAFNSALATFNTAVEGANKAIQDALKGYSDDCFAELEVLNTQISAQVKRVDNLTNRIDTSGWITTADANKLYASKTLENGQTIISYINQTAGSTTINSSKINLQGAVSFTSLNSSLQSTINGKVNSSSLGSLAYKNQVAKDLLSADLSSLIDGKADSSSLGTLAYKEAVEAAQLGSTIVVGGYLNTDYIKVKRIDAQGARVGGFTIDSGRLYWKAYDYFGGDSRSLKLGVSTYNTDGIVDVNFNAATTGKFGVKAVGSNAGGAAIYASTGTLTYPGSSMTYAGFFVGPTSVRGELDSDYCASKGFKFITGRNSNGTYTYNAGVNWGNGAAQNPDLDKIRLIVRGGIIVGYTGE